MNAPDTIRIEHMTQGALDAVFSSLDRMTELRNLYARAEGDANWRHQQTIMQLETLKAKAKALREAVRKLEQFLFVGAEFGFIHCVIMPLIDELQSALVVCDKAGALE